MRNCVVFMFVLLSTLPNAADSVWVWGIPLQTEIYFHIGQWIEWKKILCHLSFYKMDILNTVSRSKLEIVYTYMTTYTLHICMCSARSWSHSYIFFSIAFVHLWSFPHCIWANDLCFSHGSFKESVIHFNNIAWTWFWKKEIPSESEGWGSSAKQEHPQAVTQVIGLIYFCLQSKLDTIG